MASFLRHGARRIGGSPLQRAQAGFTAPAVAEERRLLLVPRRMISTGERAPEEITRDIKRKQQELADAIAEGKRSLMASTNWHHQDLSDQRPSMQEVQQKTEELYEVLSKAECWGNRRLLQNLAVHVQPRPEDSQWSRLRASKWATNVAMVVSTLSFSVGFGIALGAFGSKVRSYF